jgi:hypothetical protein
MSLETLQSYPDPDDRKVEPIHNPRSPEAPQTLFSFIASETGYILDALDQGRPIPKDEAFNFLNIPTQQYLRHAFFGASIAAGHQPPEGISANPEAARYAQFIFDDVRKKHEDLSNATVVDRIAFAGNGIPKNLEEMRYRIFEFSQVLQDITKGEIDLTAYDPLDGRITRTLAFFRSAYEFHMAIQNPDGSEKKGSRFITEEEATRFNSLLAGLHTNPDITRDQSLQDEKRAWWEEKLADIDITALDGVQEEHDTFVRRILEDVMVFPPAIPDSQTKAVTLYEKPTTVKAKVTLPPSYYIRYGLDRPLEQEEIMERSERILEKSDVAIDFARRIPTKEEQLVENLLATVNISDDPTNK